LLENIDLCRITTFSDLAGILLNFPSSSAGFSMRNKTYFAVYMLHINSGTIL